MYLKDGIVYGTYASDGNAKIASATPLDNKMLLLTFASGEKRLFDATILKGLVFQPLFEGDEIFRNPVIDHGIVTWKDGEIDIGPSFMYENSFAYTAPQ